MKRKILIVDDDEDILQLLKYNLEKEGYEVKTLGNSKRAVSTAKLFFPDLIILDIMMPEKNGIELCRKLREKGRFKETYIFFLTARSESYYQHAVFQTGGDDYIEKVFGLKTLTKKIAAVLKRDFVIRKSLTKLTVGNLHLNRNEMTASFNGHTFKLTKPEFELLFFFAQNPRKVIPTAEVIQSIWGSEMSMAVLNMEVYVQNLRNKLGVALIAKKNNHHYKLDLSNIN
jgi:two-component system, OmpR family, alkaline phosphatase synthesis response regulator PhoP